jgi:hypothetical protein
MALSGLSPQAVTDGAGGVPKVSLYRSDIQVHRRCDLIQLHLLGKPEHEDGSLLLRKPLDG